MGPAFFNTTGLGSNTTGIGIGFGGSGDITSGLPVDGTKVIGFTDCP